MVLIARAGRRGHAYSPFVSLFLPLCCALVLLCSASGSRAALPVTDGEGQRLPSLAPLIERATPAVVNIATSTTQRSYNPLFNDPFFRHFFNVPQQQRRRQTTSAGSGVIVDAADGIVITNHHVVKNADEITVILHDGRRSQAQLLGSDPEVDIAVLKIKPDSLQELSIADSDTARVGDFVVAIGNPFGLNQTVTTGIVSALGRSGLGIEGFENFIQTDASINPGNSGGALLGLDGKLLGINTAIIAPGGGNVGIGFAIPANMAMASAQQILDYGKVQRGELGIKAQDIDEDLAKAFGLGSRQGALVTSIEPDSPADKAGLQAGDVVTAMGKRNIRNASDLRNAIALSRLGETVSLTRVREGRERTVKAKIVKPDTYRSNFVADSPMARYLQGASLQRNEQGLLVRDIDQGSNAIQSGLRPGDVIVSANRRKVGSVDQLMAAIRLNERQLLLRILRGNASLYLVIR